jgi:hypothetical protein
MLNPPAGVLIKNYRTKLPPHIRAGIFLGSNEPATCCAGSYRTFFGFNLKVPLIIVVFFYIHFDGCGYKKVPSNMRFIKRVKNKDIEKHNKKNDLGISELELYRRLEEKGCPVCSVLEHHDRQYFSWFSIEKYHMPAFLESLTHALGFCANHGAYLDRQNHWASQITAVHRYTVSRVNMRMAAGLSERKNDLRRIFKDRTPCPVCASYGETSERTLWFFKKMIEEKEGLNKYGYPGILCFPHFKSLTDSASPKVFARLLSSHESTMLSTTKELESIRHQEMKLAAESEQIRHALNLTVGREQNPGNPLLLSRIYKLSENRDPLADFISSLKENTGCPICLNIYHSLSQWICWLDKNIISADNFDAVSDVLPTCNAHVWSCIRLGNSALQFAAAFAAFRAVQEKVNNAARHLKQVRKPRKQGKKEMQNNQGIIKVDPKKTITGPIYCPLCSRMDSAKNRALKLLFALLQERRYRIDFENGHGLCLKHLANALDMQPSNEIAGFLIRVESAKLALLEWELEEAMRKTAWTARPEIKGSEQSAWHRALARFSGLPISE